MNSSSAAMPLVSVVIASYNRLPFLKKAIECVRNQSYPNVQLVIFNDGSTDGTYEFLSAIELNEHDILLNNRDNQGCPKAKHDVCMKATGEFIALLDDDDLWGTDKLEKQLAYLMQFDTRKTICFTRFYQDDGYRSVLSPAIVDVEPSVGDYLFVRNGVLLPSSMMFSKEMFLCTPMPVSIYGDEHTFTGHEDWYWFLQLEREGVSFVFLPEPLTIWNVERDRARVSWRGSPEREVKWLEVAKPYLSEKACSNYAIKMILPEWYRSRDWSALCSTLRNHGSSVSVSTLLAALLKSAMPGIYFKLRTWKASLLKP